MNLLIFTKDYKLYADCIYASSVSMFKNKIHRYLTRASYTQMSTCWILDKPKHRHLADKCKDNTMFNMAAITHEHVRRHVERKDV